MEKAHNVFLKFPVMWTISKWPILMRLPRVIRKLMVSQIISLCQLITFASCWECMWLLPCRDQQQHPLYPKQWEVVKCWTFLLGFALSSFPGSWQGWCPGGLCIPFLPHTCPNPLHNPSSKGLGWLLGLAQRPHFTESPKERINTVLKPNFFSVIYFHVLIIPSKHWYVLGMRINYSDYVEPFLLEIPLLVKILKNREKILEVILTPFPREDSWMWLSLGNTIYCSEGEDGSLPKAKQDDLEDDYGPATLNPSGNSCIVLKAF